MTCGANSSYALADYVRQSAIDVLYKKIIKGNIDESLIIN